MSLPALLIGIALATGQVMAADRNDERQCREVKAKIRLVQSKMRAGYTRAKGEKLQSELRRLRVLRKAKCR